MDLKQANFSKALEKIAYQNTKWTDTVTTIDKTPKSILQTQHSKYLHHFVQTNNICHLLEFNNILIYFFTREHSDKELKAITKAQFNLSIFTFNKKDGDHSKKHFTGLYGRPSCISAGVVAKPKDQYMKNEGKKTSDDFIFRIVALIGTKDGFLKILELETDKEQKVVKPHVTTHKLQHKPIVQIIIPDKTNYNYKNISLIMFEDCKVYLFNYFSRQVVCIFKPPILNHDHGVCLTVHDSGKYFATASRTGQITFWELNQKAFEAIEKSELKVMKNKKKHNDNEQQLAEEVWSFSQKDRVITVFPLSAIHSASISGLKWISFYGNLLALITSKGCFRLLSLNLEIRDEFIVLIQYIIPNGQAITSAQLLPLKETLVVFKGSSIIEDKVIDIEPKAAERPEPPAKLTLDALTFKENMMTSQNNFFRFNYNGLEKKDNFDNSVDFIKFGNLLRVESVDKYFNKASKQPFEWGVIASDGNIVLLRNEQGFYIGPLKK